MRTHDFKKLDWLVCVDDACLYAEVALQIGRVYRTSDVSFSAVQLVGLGDHWFDASKFRKASDSEVARDVAACNQRLRELLRRWVAEFPYADVMLHDSELKRDSEAILNNAIGRTGE